ncbi:hypothetical protein RB601_009773 [Gaeumannomyces tritici]
MTSHVRTGADTYNDVVTPRYNVLSYTWGYYQDRSKTPGPALDVRGVDWPIPPILKKHFTVAAFQRAIQRATSCFDNHGVSTGRCDWLWVDVACIPQEHEGEDAEAKELRQQEIAKQVEIFKRADTAFAWLCSLRKPKGSSRGRRRPRSHRAKTRRFRRRSLHRRRRLLRQELPLVTLLEIVRFVNRHVGGFPDKRAAKQFLHKLDMRSERLSAWQSSILEHPWFKSLWTLQEMVLRPNAHCLFEGGVLRLPMDGPFNFHNMNHDMGTLSDIFVPPNTMIQRLLSDAETMFARRCRRRGGVPATKAIKAGRAVTSKIFERFSKLFALMDAKGLDCLGIEFPHYAYSSAQHRRVSRRVDRIYGIIQTYGIACGARRAGFPERLEEIAELHSLEDEFGEKLVTKAPLLSQIFIHSRTREQGPPRRSWLITQNCKVNDFFWQSFTSSYQVQNLFSTFETRRESIGGDLRLRFRGLAWQLDEFVQVVSQSSCLMSEISRKGLFSPVNIGLSSRYRGLMLDHHVSRMVLGQVVDYFHNYDEMTSAVRALYQHYCGKDRTEGDGTVRSIHLSWIRVCLLGSGGIKNTPIRSYVGIVLAPASETTWQRIGLMRWVEFYSQEDCEPYSFLPLADRVECSII